jgi:hypothetical protein
MADITRIANVQISLQTTGINKKDFNTILILCPEVVESSRVVTYTSASAMLDDGFTDTDAAYLAVRDALSQTPRPRYVKIGQKKAADASWAAALAAIVQEDNQWYGLGLTSRTSADILAVAAWAEAEGKLFGTAVSEAGAVSAASTTDTPYLLKESNYYRTFSFYHADAATDFPELACMARCFAVLPGGETWANKKLAGVTTDRLTETQFLAAKAKNCNTFESFRDSVSITQTGKVAAGEWIDVIRFRDWLQEEMQVNIFNLLINRDKVPYTDDGIATIEAKMAEALELGQRRGGIAPTEYDEDDNEIPGYVISVPLAANISANTKASRILEDMTFSARLAGAIHVAEITGSLTYEF